MISSLLLLRIIVTACFGAGVLLVWTGNENNNHAEVAIGLVIIGLSLMVGNYL